MNLKIAQVLGLNTDQKAAQVASLTREENTFLAVLELTSDDAFTKGRQALSELEDFYFEFDGTVSEKLNATFKKAQELFEGLDFSLGLAAIAGKVLYMIGKGEIEVYLKRGEKLSSLLAVGHASELISGFLQSDDKLLFSTKSLATFLNTDLAKSLSLPIETFEEEVGGKIGASDLENQGLAALAVSVTEENPEIIPVEEQAADESIPNDQDSSLGKFPVFQLFKVFQPVRLLGKLARLFPNSNRGRLVLAIFLIVIVVAGVGYKYKLSYDRKIQAQFNQALQEAKDNLSSAKGLASLNPVDAKAKLDLANNKLNQALSLKPKSAEAQDFKKQIENESSSILQQASVSDFPLFLDLDLVKKNFRATELSLSKDKLLLLDPAVKTLVVVDIAKKSNQILGGPDNLGDAFFASLNGIITFVYSKDKGVLKVDTTNSKLTTAAKKDNDLGEIKDIYGFAGNIYLLDSGKKEAPNEGQIWKYLPATTGYSDARAYLNKGVSVDFSNALRMQIESSIYILKSGGEILRFTKGDKDNFSLSGLPSAVKDPKSLFVSSDTDNLYLLDSGNSRLLILTKTGSYKGQITGSKFATATDLAVDEVGKKVYLLEGGKIYTADLK